MTGVNLNHIFVAVIGIAILSLVVFGAFILTQPQQPNPNEFNDMPPLPPDAASDFPPIPQDTPIPTPQPPSNTNNNQESNDLPPLPQ